VQKLLVTGASGFLGWNLCQIARADWEVHGTYTRHPIEIPDVRLHALDLTDLDAVTQHISALAPNAIIHTAAASQPNFCQQHPELSHRINVTASAHLAKICHDRQIPFVFTSTDLVFDGTQAPYRETDSVAPLNIYGEQKVTAEREILAAYPGASICRMPLMFGMAPPDATSFIQPWIKSLVAGERLQLFIDEFRTPVSAITAAKGLLLALKTTPEMIHLGGKIRISRYDFGLLLADVFCLDRSLISPISQKDLQMAAPRAADVSMDISKALALGYDLPPLRSELEAIAPALRYLLVEASGN
jgi:dTDP-4-dehydrorhamnose reductase